MGYTLRLNFPDFLRAFTKRHDGALALLVCTKQYRRATLRADQKTEKWNPVDYHEHSYPQYAFALGLLERLRFNGDERLLDVGCGDGKVTAALAARVPRGSVLGIDASPDMIAFARTFHRRNLMKGL